jgi:hypothetical protein
MYLLILIYYNYIKNIIFMHIYVSIYLYNIMTFTFVPFIFLLFSPQLICGGTLVHEQGRVHTN